MAPPFAPTRAAKHYLESPYASISISIFPRQCDFGFTALRLLERLMRYSHRRALLLLLLTHLLQSTSTQPISQPISHTSDLVIVSIPAKATQRSSSRPVWNPGITASSEGLSVSRASVESSAEQFHPSIRPSRARFFGKGGVGSVKQESVSVAEPIFSPVYKGRDSRSVSKQQFQWAEQYKCCQVQALPQTYNHTCCRVESLIPTAKTPTF